MSDSELEITKDNEVGYDFDDEDLGPPDDYDDDGINAEMIAAEDAMMSGKAAPKQTKKEREVSDASSWLLASKKKVEAQEVEVARDNRDFEDGMPDLDNVGAPEGRRTRDEAVEDHMMMTSEMSEKYIKNVNKLGRCYAENRLSPDDPPYACLPADFPEKLPYLSFAAVEKLTLTVTALEEVNEAVEDAAAGGKLVRMSMQMVTKVFEASAGYMEYDLTGYSDKVDRKFGKEKGLQNRLFRRYFQPYLDQISNGKGGATSDLAIVAFMLYNVGEETYTENLKKKALEEQRQKRVTGATQTLYDMAQQKVEEATGPMPNNFVPEQPGGGKSDEQVLAEWEAAQKLKNEAGLGMIDYNNVDII